MKKAVRLGLLAALVLSLLSFGAVSAQDEAAGLDAVVSYTSGFQVQNLEAAPATIVLEFYDQAGVVVASPTYTVPANGSKTFFPVGDVPVGFTGSLVISSDKDVRAINNLIGSGPGSYLATTNGFQAGAQTVNLPLIMCNNSGFNTFFSVQNAGSADATITIEYIPGSNGTAGQTDTATIKPSAAKTFDQTAGSPTKNCATLADGSGKFVGSAKITSNQPIVAAVMQLNTTTSQTLLGYGGFTGGSPVIALPLVMSNNSGFFTGIQVQNAGAASTSVTVAYSPNTAGAFDPADEVFDLAPGASKTLLQSGGAWGSNKYIGGATITNTGGQPLVAILNQLRPSPALGSAYEGFDVSTATQKISAPLIMSNNSGYFTGIQVQNVSAAAVSVTITYGANTAGAFAPAAETFDLQPGASKTVIQNGGAWGTNRYIGAATITANGNIVAIVNQLHPTAAGDQFATGDAFNY